MHGTMNRHGVTFRVKFNSRAHFTKRGPRLCISARRRNSIPNWIPYREHYFTLFPATRAGRARNLLSLRLFRVSVTLFAPFLAVVGETARWFLELCNYLGFVLRLTAGRIIARSSGGGGTRWPPISPSCPTWCRPVQPWPGSPTNLQF